jgi:hypothetical protein
VFVVDPVPENGITGFDSATSDANWSFNFPSGHNFWTVLAIFFPAVTGIMAGANISGDLKDPQYSIPKGTMWSIVISTVVYASLVWIIGAVVLPVGSDGATGGLLDDKFILVRLSAYAPLVYAGVFAATISSALASLVGAPRIIQVLIVLLLVPAGRDCSLSVFVAARFQFLRVIVVCLFPPELSGFAPAPSRPVLFRSHLVSHQRAGDRHRRPVPSAQASRQGRAPEQRADPGLRADLCHRAVREHDRRHRPCGAAHQ